MLSGLAGIYSTFLDLLLSLIFTSLSLLVSFISQYYFCLPPLHCSSFTFFLLSFSSSFSVIIRLDLSPFTTGLQFNFVVEFHILSSFHVPLWLLSSLVTLHSTSHPFTFPLLYFNTPLHFSPSKNTHALWFYPFILSTFHTATSHIFPLGPPLLVVFFLPLPRLSSSLLSLVICQGTAQADCAQHETRRNNQSKL